LELATNYSRTTFDLINILLLFSSGTTRQLLMRLRQHYRTALVEIRKRCPNRARTANFYDYFVVRLT
jgi:hypothetical protein